jgi:thiamine-monophosphate kinase
MKKTLQRLGEFGLIREIRRWMATSNPNLIQGIGDDVAVVRLGKESLLFTTDVLIEDIHFERSWSNPYFLGRKSLAVNLSDIAAMGGIPKYFLISIGLPRTLPFSFISRFYRGLKAEAKRFRVDLIGGDTSLSEKLVINICLIGQGKREGLVFRKGAQVGDELYVSGTLGDAGLGLKILKDRKRKKKPKELIDRHLTPTPRIELGQALAQSGVAHAMIDISDGLLSDTQHLLEESKVGGRIWEDRLPLSKNYCQWVSLYSKNPYQLALTGGEDYELLFTAPKKVRAKISSLSHSLGVPITCIGEILPEKEGLQLIKEDGRIQFPSRLGFDHFSTKSQEVH